jgi:hypothetical protein
LLGFKLGVLLGVLLGDWLGFLLGFELGILLGEADGGPAMIISVSPEKRTTAVQRKSIAILGVALVTLAAFVVGFPAPFTIIIATLFDSFRRSIKNYSGHGKMQKLMLPPL